MKFRLVDRIHEIIPGKSISGQKLISLEEYFLLRPAGISAMFPPMLMIESLFQLGNILIFRSFERKLGLISMFRKIEFNRYLHPGEKLDIQINLLSRIEDTVRMNGKGFIDGEIAIEGFDCTASLYKSDRLVEPEKFDTYIDSITLKGTKTDGKES